MREMKDGGVERIGLIPQSWDIIKTKYVATLYTGNSIKDEEKDNYSDSTDAIPYIATKDIEQGCNSVNYNNGLYVKEIDLTFSRAYPESTLMCIEGGSARRKKAIVDRTVCFVNKLCCFAAKSINPRYLYYCLNSPDYEDEFKQNISGLIGGVSKSTLANFFIPKPSTDDQRIIADYLDAKCSKIDEIIAKQEQIIEKLKEYKLSVITETVTRGLNPDAEMKDSGIEWLGSVPLKWNEHKLSDLCKKSITYGIVKMGDYDDENGVKALRCSDVQPGYIIEDSIRTVTQKLSKEYARTILEGGEIVINIRGTLGGCAIVPDYMKGYNIAREIAMVSVDKANTRFVMYNMLSNAFKAYQDYSLRGVIYVGLNINLLNKYPIFLPSEHEQDQIAFYLDEKCSLIDEDIFTREQLIEKLQDYKKSLIYEVVTGKKEV